MNRLRGAGALLAVVAAAVGLSASIHHRPDRPRPTVVTGEIADLGFGQGGPDDVRQLTVIDARGHLVQVRIDRDRNYGFALSHLTVHQQKQLPVVVDAERRGDRRLYALDIRDP